MSIKQLMYQCTAGATEHLESGKRTVYIGADITAPALHPGNMIALMLLRQLQDAGHQVILLLGGATTLIGDPTGRSKERELLSPEQIKANINGIEKSMRLVLGDKAKIVNNADWLCNLGWIEMLQKVGTITSVNKLVKTETFQKRLENNQHLSFLEFSYPLCQAYDFLYLNEKYGCTVQCGGSDQWANILAGVGLKDGLFGITVPLLTDINGNKISKSTHNAAWINPDLTSAFDLWQWFRNLPDFTVNQMNSWLEISKNSNINDIKVDIANYMTAIIHGSDATSEAAEKSRQIYQCGNKIEFPIVHIQEGLQLCDVVYQIGFAQSKADARRLIRQGGVVVNGQVCVNESNIVVFGDTVEVGKKGRVLHKK